MFEYQEEADEFLQQIIPHLSSFSRLSGGEGTVYFVDDNFVVKKFFEETVHSAKDGSTLLKHCSEVNRLSMQGYAIPRIYAVALPNRERKNAYLLEERAKGKSIFPIEKFESMMGLYSMKKSAKLQRELVSLFKSDFLTTNEQMEALPDSEIERFILTDYFMTHDFKFGYPDVVKDNVLFDGNTLTHIDSYFAKEDSAYTNENGESASSQTAAESTVKDMTDLMYHNGYVQEMLYKICGNDPEVRKLIRQNRALVKEIIVKFIRKSNKLVSPRFDSQYKKKMYEFMTHKIQEALNTNRIEEITNLIEKE